MLPYERFAPFYDRVMDDPGPRAARVNDCIARFRPGAASVLELGCGTGSLLARLDTDAEVWGLDRSPAMLALAAAKVPWARLVEGDMADFSLGRRFDVVLCVFDSLNHLLAVGRWVSLLEAAHAHLDEGGLLAFDVNTVGELRRLGEEPPWIYDFDGGTAVIDVSFAADEAGLGWTDWDVRIFEHVAGDRYRLHHERIGELGLPLDDVRALCRDGFELLEEVDDDGAPATDASVKAYYAWRRVDQR